MASGQTCSRKSLPDYRLPTLLPPLTSKMPALLFQPSSSLLPLQIPKPLLQSLVTTVLASIPRTTAVASGISFICRTPKTHFQLPKPFHVLLVRGGGGVVPVEGQVIVCQVPFCNQGIFIRTEFPSSTGIEFP